MPITEASRVPWGGSRAGNGAAMRCAPIAIRWRDDPVALVRNSIVSAVPTYWDTRCGWSCALLNLAAATALRGGSITGDELLNACLDGVQASLPELQQYGYGAHVPEALRHAVLEASVAEIAESSKPAATRTRTGRLPALCSVHGSDSKQFPVGGVAGSRKSAPDGRRWSRSRVGCSWLTGVRSPQTRNGTVDMPHTWKRALDEYRYPVDLRKPEEVGGVSQPRRLVRVEHQPGRSAPDDGLRGPIPATGLPSSGSMGGSGTLEALHDTAGPETRAPRTSSTHAYARRTCCSSAPLWILTNPGRSATIPVFLFPVGIRVLPVVVGAPRLLLTLVLRTASASLGRWGPSSRHAFIRARIAAQRLLAPVRYSRCATTRLWMGRLCGQAATIAGSARGMCRPVSAGLSPRLQRPLFRCFGGHYSCGSTLIALAPFPVPA